MLIKMFYIGVGGFIGSALRYITSGVVERLTFKGPFPYGTFVVNILGCVLIGFLAGYADTHDIFTTTARAFLITGLLGAFTTFSTFSYETMGLFQNGHTAPALMNMGLQIILGLIAVWGGVQFSRVV